MKHFLILLVLMPLVSLAEAVPYQRCFDLASRQHAVPVELLTGVARVESAFDPDARSHANAHGLMQIRWPLTARHLGIRRVSELYNPCVNIDAGARYLAELLHRYEGDTRLALAAYNYGPSRTYAGMRLPAAVQAYVDRVLVHEAVSEDAATSEMLVVNRFRRGAAAMHYVATLHRLLPGIRFETTRQAVGDHVVLAHISVNEPHRTRQLNRLKPLGIGEHQ